MQASKETISPLCGEAIRSYSTSPRRINWVRRPRGSSTLGGECERSGAADLTSRVSGPYKYEPPHKRKRKSPTWGNEEDDGPMAHPPAASERCPSTSQGAVPAINRAPRRRPPQQPRPWKGRPPAAPCPARLPVREDQRARDSLYARARYQGNGASTWSAGQPLRKPYRQRKLWGKTRPIGPPTRTTIKTRQPHPGHRTAAVHTRTPPDSSGSDKAIPANGSAPAEGHTARATARVIRHSRRPQPSTPPPYQTQGRAKAHSRQGNPPRTESNGSAACLNNRATPSADRARTGCAAGKPQGSEIARGADTMKTPP
ncbi:hypothetical protein WOLCODRAFT_148559 [Wolfiporia cocos MD-104 SS10]|uniref:Uncharacterized protein n=1 Tax=Wolfiporia cocos (strain MD-104) TaxID=742152 RepID=A0A2H3IWY7_WOLCO|nr:hypothetical protein WOLCODRAFT_148559 [Wolfiporia cocos MD-104 SS10]